MTKAYESENWDDQYQDDIESQGMPLIRQGQSNSPKVLEGVFGIGDFLMPNGLVAKGYYLFLAVGCDNFWVHWAANRAGLLGFLPGSETPKDTAWLKPGPARQGFPSVTKEGRYAPDGSVWAVLLRLPDLMQDPHHRGFDAPVCDSAVYAAPNDDGCSGGAGHDRRSKAFKTSTGSQPRSSRRSTNSAFSRWRMSHA